MTFLSILDRHQSHKQKKNNCIKNINLSFFKEFKSNLIHKGQSIEDKRIIINTLNSKSSFFYKKSTSV